MSSVKIKAPPLSRNGQAPQPQFQLVDVHKINPAAYNPRKDLQPSDREYKAIVRSLDDFGLVEPLVWNSRSGNLVGGHQRFKILLARGYEEVWVSVVDLPESKEKALNIALNKVQGRWDQKKLKALLQSFAPQFDLTMTGYGESEIKGLINFTGKAGRTKEDDIPELPKAKTIAKPGDIWGLGQHKIACGDSLDPKVASELFGNRKARMVATDPPYLVNYTGERPQKSGKDWTGVYHEVEIKDKDDFYPKWMKSAAAVADLDAAWYVWHASTRYPELAQAFAKTDLIAHQLIIWAKPSAVFGFSYYPWQHEPCLFGWKKGHMPEHDGDNSHNNTTVWPLNLQKTIPAAPGAVTVIAVDVTKDTPLGSTSLWRCDWDGKKKVTGNERPTQKPVEIFAIPMRKHTRAGDICFEPFSGSGTQIIAAEKLNRICYAIEIEPYFVDLAVRRWEAFTGKKAKVIGHV